MNLIDTHCHIDVSEFDADRQTVLQHCAQLGVADIVVPGIARRSWEGLLQLCNKHPGLHPAIGLHPLYISEHTEHDLQLLSHLLRDKQVVAVGEIGLDYYIELLDRERQQFFFEAQLELALQYHLPVLLHVRRAHDQVLQTLRQSGSPGGIAHAFNGSLQQAQQYIDLGFKLGFGGTMTFERSTKIRKLARELPLEAIVLETDAPDMTVASHHGERNSPEYLPECLHALCEIRGMTDTEVAQQLAINTNTVLHLHDRL